LTEKYLSPEVSDQPLEDIRSVLEVIIASNLTDHHHKFGQPTLILNPLMMTRPKICNYHTVSVAIPSAH
jgi:hypothetical protein